MTDRIAPPIVGPRTGASIVGTPVIAETLPMFLGPAALAIIICPTGRIIPPPTPWSTRKAISSVVDVAMPQSAEPSVNISTEKSQTFLAPKRRLAQPLSGIAAASDSM